MFYLKTVHGTFLNLHIQINLKLIYRNEFINRIEILYDSIFKLLEYTVKKFTKF